MIRRTQVEGRELLVFGFGLYPKGAELIALDGKPWAMKSEGQTRFSPVPAANGGSEIPFNQELADHAYRMAGPA